EKASADIGTLYRRVPPREQLIAAIYRSETERLAASVPKFLQENTPGMAFRQWVDAQRTERCSHQIVADGGTRTVCYSGAGSAGTMQVEAVPVIVRSVTVPHAEEKIVPRSLRADARANHERLLEVAARMFAREGADTSLTAIAAEAGVGIGTLYRRFPSRNDLIEDVYRNETTRLCESAPLLLDGLA
ncbi:TetR/AcrR family transcriptional regulator, partial [Streptomyces sp. NPDC059083]|uniref:TetR/AcrR family transcriptional regulator n=1 Tax=Streptomyces sp. NPDC059083 TaxID=3346721 RepID=UPI0036AE4380